MMESSEAFGELRSLLNRGRPSTVVFMRLMHLCAARWGEAPAEVEDAWLPYVASHLGSWPDTHRLLDVSDVTFDPREPAPWMALARRLSLSRSGLGDDDVDAIGLRTVHRELRGLDLSHNALGQQGARRLARLLSRTSALESLDVSHNTIGWPAARALLDALAPTSVRALTLGGVSGSGDGVEGLIGADTSGFDALEVSRVFLGDARCAALIGSGLFDGLERLSLVGLSMGDLSAAALAERAFARLRALDLSGSFFHIGEHGGVLARLDAPTLESFALRDTLISTHGADELAYAPWFVGLRALDLSYGRMGAGIVRQLLKPGGLRGLRSIDLSFAKPDRADLVALAREATQLERVSLGMCGVDDWGVVALCEGEAPLAELDLSSNADLGARAMRALSSASQRNPLRTLDLRGCNLDVAAARALEGLRVGDLDLSGCHLGDRGLAALCEVGVLDDVEVLTLRDNILGPASARALAGRGVTWGILDVGENQLDEGAREVLTGAADLVVHGDRARRMVRA